MSVHGFFIGILISVSSWGCAPPGNASGPGGMDSRIALTFANVSKGALGVLVGQVESSFREEALASASECKREDDRCQETKVHEVRLRYEDVVSKLNAAATLQNTLAALTEAEVDCARRGDRSCADEKERAILSQIPSLLSLVDAVKNALPHGRK